METEVFIKAWYNQDNRGYDFFLPNGEEILMNGLKATVIIDDNWNSDKNFPSIAKVEFLVEVVNEKPVKQSSENL